MARLPCTCWGVKGAVWIIQDNCQANNKHQTKKFWMRSIKTHLLLSNLDNASPSLRAPSCQVVMGTMYPSLMCLIAPQESVVHL